MLCSHQHFSGGGEGGDIHRCCSRNRSGSSPVAPYATLTSERGASGSKRSDETGFFFGDLVDSGGLAFDRVRDDGESSSGAFSLSTGGDDARSCFRDVEDSGRVLGLEGCDSVAETADTGSA